MSGPFYWPTWETPNESVNQTQASVCGNLIKLNDASCPPLNRLLSARVCRGLESERLPPPQQPNNGQCISETRNALEQEWKGQFDWSSWVMLRGERWFRAIYGASDNRWGRGFENDTLSTELYHIRKGGCLAGVSAVAWTAPCLCF